MNRHTVFLTVVSFLLVSLSAIELHADDLDKNHRVTKSDIEAMMKSLSNWGRWGEDDQFGVLNLITPDKEKQAAQLVKEGISISLAHKSVKEEIDQSQPFEQKVTLDTGIGLAGSTSDLYSANYRWFHPNQSRCFVAPLSSQQALQWLFEQGNYAARLPPTRRVKPQERHFYQSCSNEHTTTVGSKILGRRTANLPRTSGSLGEIGRFEG